MLKSTETVPYVGIRAFSDPTAEKGIKRAMHTKTPQQVLKKWGN